MRSGLNLSAFLTILGQGLRRSYKKMRGKIETQNLLHCDPIGVQRLILPFFKKIILVSTMCKPFLVFPINFGQSNF